ncbi:dentin sialophosphoprotein-like [Ruditapes philippinarum]|uniref:dentin sialophosphoprotein-like n=1 Tax=Ruditapes philippinarum TaxID=129788 RepID=UPI00295B25ED|nr:dentin sialophosphoprotein-like [Ruditapes philippinarum]
MAEQTDVNEMFQKMGERLGWFKDKNEAKQGLSLSARKKTKMKKENTDKDDGSLKPNGKTADKLKLKKKKTTVENKTNSKQKGITETKPKQTNPQFKAQTFQVFASSDSDSSFTDVPKQKGKPVKAKAVLQVCSDSDDDFAVTSNTKNHFAKTDYTERDSDACIKESFVDSCVGNNLSDGIQIPKFEPILNIGPKRESSLDYDDTVVKNRVSLASCTLDLDSLGEPLVESTRIHRRSSITYKNLIEELGSSPEDNNDVNGTKKFGKGSMKKIDEMLDLEESVCNETNQLYITAIESVDDTLNSSESSPSSDKLVNELRENGKNKINKKNADRSGKSKITMNLDSSESGEEIEVVDTATQTDEVLTYDDECIEEGKETEKLIHCVYKEETIVDNQGKLYDFDNKYRDPGDIYSEDTVDDGHVNAGKHPVHELESSNPELPDIYSGDTINQLGHTLASTTIDASVHDYSNETVARETDDNFEIPTSVVNGNVSDKDIYMNALGHNHVEVNMPLPEEVQDIDINGEGEKEQMSEEEDVSTEDQCKLKADESLYEVNDAGTQTEDLDEVEEIGNADNEENQNDFIISSSFEDKGKNNDCSVDDMNENAAVAENNSDEKNNLVEDISDESDTSERSQEDKFANMTESSDSDAVSASFAKLAKKSGSKKIKKVSQKANMTDQSWRSSKRYSSDSSEDGDLEAFFQKLRKPEQKKSPDASLMRENECSDSMDDFIVEDDDMTSESDDSGFHLRETHELEKKRDQSPRLPGVKSAPTYYNEDEDDDDDDDDDFSSKIYPPSVTKHKKQTLGKARKQTNISWSFSSDSEEYKEAKSLKSKDDNKSKDQKSTKSLKNDKKSTICVEFSSDSGSDNELFDIESLKRVSNENRNSDFKTTESSNNVSQDKKKIYDGIGKSNSSTGLSGSLNAEEPLFKTPNPLRKKKSVIEENKENVFKTPVSTKGRESRTPKSTSKPVYISLSDTDSDGDDSSDFLVSISDSSTNSKTSGTPATPLSLKNGTISKATPLSLKNLTTPRSTPLSAKSLSTYSFLKSLSNTTEDSRRHPDAKRFINNFKKNKGELSAYLYKLYNQNIFENKLPSDMPVIWNKRLLRTAGYCAYKKNWKDDRDRSTRIELSVKVCDNAERVRDTLIHEMCHAAVWLLNGVNGGHGSYWKYWARHATRVHPELPAVSVCHSYSINTKFTYRCKSCGYSIGRHSKSLDVKKKVCGYCRGEFELIHNSVPTTPTSAASSTTSSTPRPPNKFALFVKDNYNSVKRMNQDLKHGDVMKELSKLFAESKIAT